MVKKASETLTTLAINKNTIQLKHYQNAETYNKMREKKKVISSLVEH